MSVPHITGAVTGGLGAPLGEGLAGNGGAWGASGVVWVGFGDWNDPTKHLHIWVFPLSEQKAPMVISLKSFLF